MTKKNIVLDRYPRFYLTSTTAANYSTHTDDIMTNILTNILTNIEKYSPGQITYICLEFDGGCHLVNTLII